ncbi:MAG: hypothetical protein AB7R69_03585 [Candidatus Babeliales bacterium]
MKKIIIVATLLIAAQTYAASCAEKKSCPQECYASKDDFQCSRFTTAFSSGYVFKNDGIFRDVYGLGMVNVLTADICYHPWERLWGIGGKISYWLARGRTTMLRQRTFLQEIPVSLYVRKMKDFASGLRLYGSLGGCFAYIKEDNYLAHTKRYKGLGEVEAGLFYPVWRRMLITAAARYLFPRQGHPKVDVGGVDLRAGIGFFF